MNLLFLFFSFPPFFFVEIYIANCVNYLQKVRLKTTPPRIFGRLTTNAKLPFTQQIQRWLFSNFVEKQTPCYISI